MFIISFICFNELSEGKKRKKTKKKKTEKKREKSLP